ncbi:kelch repeat and BTB domain-containing protein 8-like [Branchiostoma lanceolatum]|uniref:kelch repeat and BTB domain-containing protein 8-like n=1 Tax=Branchiostoma lanceolatum TaxID=7740 RepID=UPI0034528DDF
MNVTNEDYPKEVLYELNELRKRAELTDVVLEVEGRSFPCHRSILASCSPYFRTMFTSGYAEAKQERISIQDVAEVAMATILDYAYSGRLQTEPDQVQALMSAAKLLQVRFVDRKAAEYMKDHLDVSNCVDVLMYADMLGDCDLFEASESYAALRFNQVALQPSFLQLPLPLLQSFLNREDLMTNLEDNIVQTALKWIKFDQKERLQHLPALCRCFRHSFISSQQLMEIESKGLSTDSKLVYSDSTTQRLGQTRTEMQIFLHGGFLDGNSFVRDHDSQQCAPCYDPSSGGLYAINMPENLGSFSVTVTPDDDLYLAGGLSRSRIGQIAIRQTAFYQYNHLLNTWEPRCEMILPRARCGLVYLKGYIYAIGGNDAEKTVERYNPSCDEWTSIPPLPRPMSSELCAVTLDGSIYVISRNGCYCFSTTENTWKKIEDMIHLPSHPQAITYRGSIYCVNCYKDWGSKCSLTCVERYDPTKGQWKLSENGYFYFNKAALMEYGEAMYLLTKPNNIDGTDQWSSSTWEKEKTMIFIYQYQPETDSWLYLGDKGRLVPPLARWLGYGSRVDCLTARLIPMCLVDSNAFEDLEVPPPLGH